MILDTKGMVQSAHIGFSEDLINSLASEIDTLLAGKSLLDANNAARRREANNGFAANRFRFLLREL